jgi:acetoin utilization deacetylase AcuC-like enzyme
LAARDRRVIEAARSRGLPIACVIGGGYDADIDRLARRHATVHRVATAFV